MEHKHDSDELVPLRPLEQTAASANLTFYGPEDRTGAYVFAEVLADTFRKIGGEWRRADPRYTITVFRFGVGRIGQFRYDPALRPDPITLSGSVVTSLISDWMQAHWLGSQS